MKSKKEERVGEIFVSYQGESIRILEYINAHSCTIILDEKYTMYQPSYSHIKEGNIKNPYHPSVYGVGFMGQGIYNSIENGRMTKYYKDWGTVLQRSYDIKLHKRYPTYKDVTVCQEWYNFQNFSQWHEQNYKSHMQGWNLDKDILKKGNKMYSPYNCCFIPQEINKLFTKRQRGRGDLPIGVSRRNSHYQSSFTANGKNAYVGVFKTPEEAFQAYKTAKETHIKEIAEKWKHQISPQVYQALINYQVEITD